VVEEVLDVELSLVDVLEELVVADEDGAGGVSVLATETVSVEPDPQAQSRPALSAATSTEVAWRRRCMLPRIFAVVR